MNSDTGRHDPSHVAYQDTANNLKIKNVLQFLAS